MDICEDKSKTVGDCSLAFKIGELKIEDIDILSFDFEPIVFNCLREVVVYIKRTLRVSAIVGVQSSREFRRTFFWTSVVIGRIHCSLIYGFFHSFVI